MFRASSEMAVATTARSVERSPHCVANSRPFWRAVTMSASRSMGTRTSSAMSADLMFGALSLAVKVREALFQVQRGGDSLERQPQVDHGERHLRLDPYDDGLRPAEPDHVGDVAEGTSRERIDHVERGDIDDDSSGPDLADRHDQRVTELLEVLVGERRLHRRDQIGALLEDRNLHGPLAPLRGMRGRLFLRQNDLVAEMALGLFDAALEVADRVHLAQVHPDINKGLGDLGR